MSGMYGTTPGFRTRGQRQPPGAQQTTQGPSVGTGVSQQQQQQVAGAMAPGQMQAPQVPQGPIGQVRGPTNWSNVGNAGMSGTGMSNVAGIMNSQPDRGGVVAGTQVAPAAQATGLPPGVDPNDPRNAALAGYMAQ